MVIQALMIYDYVRYQMFDGQRLVYECYIKDSSDVMLQDMIDDFYSSDLGQGDGAFPED